MRAFRIVLWVLVICSLLFLQPGLLAQAGGEGAAAPSGPPLPDPAAAPPESPANTQVLHIVVGRSVIINLQSRLRRVLVSNPGVVDSLTTSPTQVVVTAKAPGTSSIILWDESGESRILDVYADVDVSALRDALDQAFSSESVQVTSDQGRVMLSGVVRNKLVADDITKMAQAYNKDVVSSLTISGRHPRQVMLKVRFAEVDRSKLTELGINIFSTGLGHTPFVTSTQQFGPPSLGSSSGGIPGAPTNSISVSDLLNIFVFNPDINLGATIKALQQHNVLQILAEPNLLAVDGQPASFQAGGEFPFPVPQAGVGGTGVITIQFKPFGVRLGFTANIQSDDVVHLKVAPEVSTLDFSNALRFGGFVVPALSTRTAETEIELKSGQTFGVAGLLDNRTTLIMSKIPGIGDIPILGYLFRSKSTNLANTELMVLVTPIIVDPVNRPEAEPPKSPEMPAPFMNVPKFDENVDKNKKPAPQEPPK